MIEEKNVVIKLENIKKKYVVGENDFWALKGINLQMKQGEFVSIVGKSGSGKSTLLNILGGIDTPSVGNLWINEKSVNGMKENQLSRFRGENIGFVFQFFQLMPTLTVLENVIMPMDFLKKISSAKRKEKAMELLKKVGMEKHSGKFPSSLSGGEQQRVAIARALANDPKIIFADEPTGNLDTNTSDEIFKLLESLTLEGKNVVMVTHSVELAKRCKRIITIRDGEIESDLL